MKSKPFYYLLVASVFIANILILVLTPENIGFGNVTLALVGLFMALVGFIFWLGGMISLGKGFALFPEPKKLVKNGLYRLTKHPIYFGMTLALTGLALAKGTILGILFTLCITTPLNYFRARLEEKTLKSLYGVKYK